MLFGTSNSKRGDADSDDLISWLSPRGSGGRAVGWGWGSTALLSVWSGHLSGHCTRGLAALPPRPSGSPPQPHSGVTARGSLSKRWGGLHAPGRGELLQPQEGRATSWAPTAKSALFAGVRRKDTGL